ncbi:MAG: PPC domain-containing protein, partial [Caulobacterales bacterium]|nr:PPC domain-containing protein [Caulobacterales bacterium]
RMSCGSREEVIARATALPWVGGARFEGRIRSSEDETYCRIDSPDAMSVSISLDDLDEDVDLELLGAGPTGAPGPSIASSTAGGADAEQIDTLVGAGAYYLRIYTVADAESDFTLSIESVERADAADTLAPNSSAAPHDLGVVAADGEPAVVTDIVSPAGAEVFAVEVAEAALVTILLTDLNADADLYVNDADGFEVGSSALGGSADDQVQWFAQPGRFIATVSPVFSGGLSRYTLAVEAQAADIAELGVVSAGGPRVAEGAVTAAARQAWHRFELTEPGRVSLALTGLTADAELHLVMESGAVLMSSTNGGNDPEEIVQELDAGSYFARVDAYDDAGTPFRLEVGRAR